MDRVVERRRAVALAQLYREFEGLWIREIADRLARAFAADDQSVLLRPASPAFFPLFGRLVGPARAIAGAWGFGRCQRALYVL